MIIIVEGKLGSGKTYWAVNYMIEKLYEYKAEIFQYVPKGRIRVITNIRDLELPHVDLDTEIERCGGLGKVFSADYEGMKDVGLQTLFIVDEAQGPTYFHRKFYNPEVFLFFQKSRHLGLDIILITQDKWTLSKEVQVLSEYNVVALPRSVRTKNVFMYKYMYGQEVGRRKSLMFNKRIAGLYKSFDKVETEKVTYLWKKYAVAVVICFLVVVGCFKLALGTFFNQGKDTSKKGGRSPAPIAANAPESKQSGASDRALTEWEKLGNSPGQKRASYRSDGNVVKDGARIKSDIPVEGKGSPGGGNAAGVEVGREGEVEHEPLIPMKCEKADSSGWQECFEGGRYVGRFKAVEVRYTLPEYGKRSVE